MDDFRSSMTDREMMDKYGVSASGLVALIKKLVAQKLIKAEDLELRKRKAEQRDLAKEAQFLSTLYLCPACGHPHPQPFQECPACGAAVEDLATTQRVLDSMSTSGGHIYVDEVEEMAQKEAEKGQAIQEEELEEEAYDEEAAEEEEIVDESGSFEMEDEEEYEDDSRTFEPFDQEEDDELDTYEKSEPLEKSEEPEEPEKESTVRVIKSFFTRKFKKR